jgi:hypothetical protein
VQSDPALDGIHPLHRVLQAQPVEGDQLVVAVPERQRRSRERVVLGEHVEHPVVEPQVPALPAEDLLELVDDVLSLLPAGGDGGDRPVDLEGAQRCAGRGHEALRTQQDGAHGGVRAYPA